MMSGIDAVVVEKELQGVRKPLCAGPWYYLLLGASVYGPCCYYMIDNDSSKNDANLIPLLYHSDEMRSLRKRLASGNISGTLCEKCIKNGTHMEIFPDFPNLDSSSANLNISREAYAQNAIDFDATPLQYNLLTSFRCNLKCIMCSPRKPLDDDFGIDVEGIVGFYNRSGWDNIAQITVAGGEPLLTKDALYVIGALAEQGNAKTVLELYTNGLLLHRHMDTLEKIKSILFRVSVDATGEAYELIRVGGKWSRMEKNLRLLSDAMQRHHHWGGNIIAVIMRSSIPQMKNLIQIAIELKLQIYFGRCRDNYLDENVFAFPHLLETLDWEKGFDEAIKLAEDSGYMDTASNLLMIRATLGANIKNSTDTVQVCSFANKVEAMSTWMEKIFGGSPYYIFGTSHDLLSAMATKKPSASIKGVCDFTSFPGRYCGYPLYSQDKLKGYKGNILVNSSTYNHSRYLDYINKEAPDAEIRFMPKWSEKTLSKIDRLCELHAKAPVVGFGVGGVAKLLIAETNIKKLNFVAFSDNDKMMHGREFQHCPVLAPDRILDHAKDVVILSEAFQSEIKRQLSDLYGESLGVHCIF